MLQIEHLSFDVRDDGRQAEILSDISFNVADGEMLVITGPNGGGKSTLAKLLMGINEATSGRIILNGEDITDLSINERAQAGIGFAFQQPPRFKGMTVRRPERGHWSDPPVQQPDVGQIRQRDHHKEGQQPQCPSADCHSVPDLCDCMRSAESYHIPE